MARERQELAPEATDVESDGADWQSEGPEERGSRGSRGCGIVGCLLLVGILVALGAGAFALTNALEPLADRYLWAPHDVVREYLGAYDRGDTERARRFLCSDIRSGQPPDPAEPLGGGGRGFGGEIDDFPYPRAGGRVAIFYQLDQHGSRAEALLEREDDGWRICAFG